jgi:hypothetical protein
MYGASTANEMWMSYAKPLAMGQFLFVIISFICYEIKPVATTPITDKTRASISSGRALLKRLTAKVQPVRISAHNSKEPSCPPQIAWAM